MRSHDLDGAQVLFDRDTGLNILRRGPRSSGLTRRAPRTLQISLLTPCNLKCGFCYRDTHAPSRWTRENLLLFLRDAADWGVLEVAFGGGEPLLFKDFVEVLREAHASTPLGLNFTTNGTLLTTDVLESLRGVVGELRVSAYDDNDYRATLRRARDFQVGLNLLVTPRNVGAIEVLVADALSLGAKNVLLLGYKGDDASMQLSPSQFEQLQRVLRRMEGLPLKLDVCWHPRLGDVAQLFARSDCGAGDEFLALTADRQVQACSFAKARLPFDSVGELAHLWNQLRADKPHARIGGCTRDEFVPQPTASFADERAWTWRAFASNNSGDWTMAARFSDEATARKVAASLRELARAHEAFLASAQGQAFVEKNQFDGTVPTPPLLAFAEAHGFQWRPEGLTWEADGGGAPVLTAGDVHECVVVFHPYCSGLPAEPFTTFFALTGATSFQVSQPRVFVTASGRNATVEAQLAAFFAEFIASPSPWQLRERTPWGGQCIDPRVPSDEDGDASLDQQEAPTLETSADGVRLALTFRNSFAGPVALQKWLALRGFTDVRAELAPLTMPLTPAEVLTEPKVGLFGDVRPLEERLADLTPLELVRALLETGGNHPVFTTPLLKVHDEDLEQALTAVAREWWSRQQPLAWRLAQLARRFEKRVRFGPLIEEAWPHEAQKQQLINMMPAHLDATSAFTLVNDWLIAAASDPTEFAARFVHVGGLGDERLLDALEASGVTPTASDAWRSVIRSLELSWARAERWLGRGGTWQALALYTLAYFNQHGPPTNWARPNLEAFLAALPTSPERAQREVKELRANPRLVQGMMPIK